MSPRPAGLGSRWNRRLGHIDTRNLDARVDPWLVAADVEAGAERARAADVAALTKVHHPAVEAVEWKAFRVIRRYRQHGDIQSEDIGGFRTEAEALALCNRELGWAMVLGQDGKRKAWNGQTMETR